MADSKKYNGSTWRHSLRKLGTDTDTFTTLPTNIITDGTNASIGLVGNMSQSGTPTPENPISPQETGERTKNLFDKDNADIADLYPDATTREIKQSSNLSTWSIVLPVEPSTTYTFTMGEATTAIRRRVGMCSDYPTKGAYCTSVDDTPEYDHPNLGNIFTTDADTRYVLIMYVSGAGRDVAIERANRVQVVKGSTALPYEPYGYKIPISSAGQTNNIYLGEVPTTRRIKKLVLTGTNADGEWKKSSIRTGSFYLNVGTNATVALGLCDRAVNVGTIEQYNSIGEMFVESSGTSKLINLWLFDTNISLDDFKTYLQQQYAAGTPVTVWYVLATPETGIVNEPLRKIGDYADEVSGITIPTITGKDSFDVLTTLKPSEVSLTYTGWHDAEVKEWDGSEWQ